LVNVQNNRHHKLKHQLYLALIAETGKACPTPTKTACKRSFHQTIINAESYTKHKNLQYFKERSIISPAKNPKQSLST